MIQEIMLFGMGFLLASLLRILKVAIFKATILPKIDKDIAEAEQHQKEFREKGSSKELVIKQIESAKKLSKHIATQEILEKFNYIIW